VNRHRSTPACRIKRRRTAQGTRTNRPSSWSWWPSCPSWPPPSARHSRAGY